MPDTPPPKARSGSRGGRHYPGRPELDRANATFRRAVARVFRDPDPATSAKAAALVAEAVQALDAVTDKALKAQEESAHHRAFMAKEKARQQRLLRKAARAGSPGALRLLERLQDGPPDDAA